MPRAKRKSAPKPPAVRAAWGAAQVDAHTDFWCGWFDMRHRLSERPDVYGFTGRAPEPALDSLEGALGLMVAVTGVVTGRDVSPAATAACTALEVGAPGAGVFAVRDDLSAERAWKSLGSPTRQGQRTAPAERPAPPWWAKELGVPFPATRQQIAEARRRAVAVAHPDHGGSAEQFQRIERAYTAAQGWLAEREHRAAGGR